MAEINADRLLESAANHEGVSLGVLSDTYLRMYIHGYSPERVRLRLREGYGSEAAQMYVSLAQEVRAKVVEVQESPVPVLAELMGEPQPNPPLLRGGIFRVQPPVVDDEDEDHDDFEDFDEEPEVDNLGDDF
jgi:hypothetical protein